MLRTIKRKRKPVHLRTVGDDTTITTYCGKVDADGRYTFKRSQTTCPVCIEEYRIKGATTNGNG